MAERGDGSWLVRRSAERAVSSGDGIRTLHSFSYAAHYDPANVAFGPLIAINEEQLDAGACYDAHRHSDVEIVTWVLDGELTHSDTSGSGASSISGVVRPGRIQRLSAGSGVEHVERNGSRTAPLRFVQMMLASRHWGEPAQQVVDVDPGPGLHETVSVAAAARLVLARTGPQPLDIPSAPGVLVHATRGRMRLRTDGLAEPIVLQAGDEARAVAPGHVALDGDGDGEGDGGGSAEALVWLLDDRPLPPG